MNVNGESVGAAGNAELRQNQSNITPEEPLPPG